MLVLQERLEFFVDGVFVITMMLIMVELSAMASQELLTMSRVRTPFCDDPEAHNINLPAGAVCQEPAGEDWQGKGAGHGSPDSSWFPSVALHEACEGTR
jgi:hypothetical protein